MADEMPFKVWHIPQIPMEAFEVMVPTIGEAQRLCDALGHYDLFQFENKIKPDYCNANGIMWRGPDGTEDWCDMEDDEIEHLLAREPAQ
jgi:hypothetical protein